MKVQKPFLTEREMHDLAYGRLIQFFKDNIDINGRYWIAPIFKIFTDSCKESNMPFEEFEEIINHFMDFYKY